MTSSIQNQVSENFWNTKPHATFGVRMTFGLGVRKKAFLPILSIVNTLVKYPA